MNLVRAVAVRSLNFVTEIPPALTLRRQILTLLICFECELLPARSKGQSNKDSGNLSDPSRSAVGGTLRLVKKSSHQPICKPFTFFLFPTFFRISEKNGCR